MALSVFAGPTRFRPTVSALLVAAFAVIFLLALPFAADAKPKDKDKGKEKDPPKADGQRCRTNQSCAGKVCLTAENEKFGICCTRRANDDATCDGHDDDCDGALDEDYAPRVTVCGAGVCAASGTTSCTNGEESATCTPACDCSIEGNGHEAGDLNPDQPCEACDPTVSDSAWSPRADGTSCDDEDDLCTTGGVCAEGICRLSNTLCIGGTECSPLRCNPASGQCEPVPRPDDTACGSGGLCCEGSCTTANCGTCGTACAPTDECVSGACVPAACEIDGERYEDGEHNPANLCEVCTASQTTSFWSRVVCPNDPFSISHLCSELMCNPASGLCEPRGLVDGRCGIILQSVCCDGTPTGCVDDDEDNCGSCGNVCAEDATCLRPECPENESSCTIGPGQCFTEPPTCLIGGQEYTHGTVQAGPNQLCSRCDTNLSVLQWSPYNEGGACNGIQGTCVNGVCTPWTVTVCTVAYTPCKQFVGCNLVDAPDGTGCRVAPKDSSPCLTDAGTCAAGVCQRTPINEARVCDGALSLNSSCSRPVCRSGVCAAPETQPKDAICHRQVGDLCVVQLCSESGECLPDLWVVDDPIGALGFVPGDDNLCHPQTGEWVPQSQLAADFLAAVGLRDTQGYQKSTTATSVDIATLFTCTNALPDAGETDVDCGGQTNCHRCALGKRCTVSSDCLSNVCTGGRCEAAP